MLPNLQIPPLEIYGPIQIEPFGALVAAALVLGYFLARRRARIVGLDPFVTDRALIWTVVGGFIGAHWVSAVFYFPDKIAQNPLYLLYFWDGLSSFGGFLGGAVAAAVFFRFVQPKPFLPYAEAIAFGLVPGWILGRLGCTIAFDHPGTPTDFFLGMLDRAGVVRHNLGLYEMLYTVLLTAVLYGLGRFRPFVGFHLALILVLYAPVRFLLDFLRIADKRYFDLTFGQYFSFLLLGLAGWLIASGLKGRRSTERPTLEAAPTPAADPDGGSADST